MKQIGIYQIRNLVNGNIYVGRSIDLAKRQHQHFYTLSNGTHTNILLQRAYAKYGRENFVFETIEYCDVDTVKAREQHYIDLLDPSTSYNISISSDGGDTKRNHPNKKEWCEQHSKTIKALWEREPERNTSFQTSSREYWNQPENYQRRVDSWSGEKNPMAGSDRKGAKNPFYGKKHSPDVINKLKELNSGRPWTDDIRNRTLLSRQCTYNVDGVQYNTITEIQQAFDVSWKYVNRRLKSDEFSTWCVVYPS